MPASLARYQSLGQMGVEDCNTGLGLGMGMSVTVNKGEEIYSESHNHKNNNHNNYSNNPPVQLDLLPLGPIPRDSSSPLPAPGMLSWQPLMNNSSANGDTGETRTIRQVTIGRQIDVNKLPTACYYEEDAIVSSPNSTISSFQMDSAMVNQESYALSVKRERDVVTEDFELDRACSRASDEEEEGGTRKKLRLSKEQSALLEESFKENSTLNPKQKQALAKQLNLRPRQVEVWFQNRRARTKLKQTEVDCEFLKRCCESLTDENRRLHKELQELRALKLASPFYMQLPAATLTMCPSCERVVTSDNSRAFPLAKPQFYPYTHSSAAC
eukprot:Gb_03793 [translate_table: standard]